MNPSKRQRQDDSHFSDSLKCQHRDDSNSNCGQCQKNIPPLDDFSSCGDCNKKLCSVCAGENNCLCSDSTTSHSGIICEDCVVSCESCAGLTLCQTCKFVHLRLCDTQTWVYTTLASTNSDIIRKEIEIETIEKSINDLQRQLSDAKELLKYAWVLKYKAEEVAAALIEEELNGKDVAKEDL
jgi:hypothetical protein